MNDGSCYVWIIFNQHMIILALKKPIHDINPPGLHKGFMGFFPNSTKLYMLFRYMTLRTGSVTENSVSHPN